MALITKIRPLGLTAAILLAGLFWLGLCYQAQPFQFRVDVGAVDDSLYLAGFYPSEHNDQFNFRWSHRESYVNLPYPGVPDQLLFRAAAPRANGEAVPVTIIANGKEIGRITLTGAPQEFNLHLSKVIFGPEELSLTFRPATTFAEPKGRAELGFVLDWIEIRSAKTGFGLTVPPPFTMFWWLLIAALPFGLAGPLRWTGRSLSALTFIVAGLLYLWPDTATYLRQNLVITGLQIMLAQLGIIIVVNLFRPGKAPGKFLRHPATLLFTGLLLLYLSTMRGYFSYGDDQIMLAVSANIVAGHPAAPITNWLDLPPGVTHSKYGLGQSLVAAPLYGLGQWLSSTLPFMESGTVIPRGFSTWIVLLFGPLVTALAALVLYRIIRLLGFGSGYAFTSGVIFGVATLAWHYSRTFLSEPMTTLCLLVAFTACLEYSAAPRIRWIIGAGFALGLAVATRSFNLAVVPFFVLYLVAIWWKAGRRPATGLRLLLAFGLPLVFWLALVGWWNYARFGNPLQTGYGVEAETGFSAPIWEGLYGQLFSPGKSLFLYTPVLLAGLAGLPVWWRRRDQRAALYLSWGIIVVYILIYSLWYQWFGGGVWGPRFLVPIIPFLLLPLPGLLELLVKFDWRQGWRRRISALSLAALTLAVTLASLGIQLLSVIYSYWVYSTYYDNSAPSFWRMIYTLTDSPLIFQFSLWQNNERPDFSPRVYHDTPFARFVAFFQSAAWLLFIFILGLALLALLHKLKESRVRRQESE